MPKFSYTAVDARGKQANGFVEANDQSDAITQIRQLGAKVMVIGPIPKPPVSVPVCLSAHLTDATACTFPLAQTVNAAGETAERAAVIAAGGSYVNTEPWFCAGPTCAVITGNIEMWRDDNHITATFSAFLAPALGAEIALVLPPPT